MGNTQTGKIVTIQNEIERTLSKILDREILITASGRTDTGVHAQTQLAIFNLPSRAEDWFIPQKMISVINKKLPFEIIIDNIRFVKDTFHPRYGATCRHYRYKFLSSDIAKKQVYHSFFHDIAHYPFPVDVKRLRSLLKVSEGIHDFSNFTSSANNDQNTRRKIFRVEVSQQILSKSYLTIIDIFAQSFLHHMVRSLVGETLHLLQKNVDYPEIVFKEMLSGETKNPSKHRAKPEGLTLQGVFFSPIFD